MKKLFVYSLFLFLWGLVACESEPTPQIAFYSDRDGENSLYFMNADGSKQERNDNPVFDMGALFQWSPDRERVAFTSGANIIVATANGKLLHQFGDNKAIINYPSWSPDGEYIVFHSTWDESFDIYTARYDGTELTQLTDTAPFIDESCATWSPDGEWIAYGHHEGWGGGFTLRLIRPDGSDLSENLDGWAGTCCNCPQIDWSADSRYIAAVSWHLRIIDIENGTSEDIVAECAKRFPDFSPDGTKILFMADNCTKNSKQEEIFVINVDGSGLKQLTDNEYSDYGATWSPDGSKIAFVSNRDGNYEIYLMNPDGSEQVNLTQNEANDRASDLGVMWWQN